MKELLISLIFLTSLLYILMVVFHIHGIVKDVTISWLIATIPLLTLFLLLAFDGLRNDELLRKYI